MPVAPTPDEGTSRARSRVPPQGTGGTPADGKPQLAPLPLQVAGGHPRSPSLAGKMFGLGCFFLFFRLPVQANGRHFSSNQLQTFS